MRHILIALILTLTPLPVWAEPTSTGKKYTEIQEYERKSYKSRGGIFLDSGQSKREYNDSWVHCPAEIHPKYNKPKPDNHCKPLNPTFVKVTMVHSGSLFSIDSPIKNNEPIEPRKRWALRKLTKIVVAGVDTPKTNGKCSAEKQKAIKARDFVRNLIQDKSVTLQKMIIRKFTGLVIADVILDGGESLADKLINEGLGHYHSYGKKEGWCPVE